jgi:hypothetical protein
MCLGELPCSYPGVMKYGREQMGQSRQNLVFLPLFPTASGHRLLFGLSRWCQPNIIRLRLGNVTVKGKMTLFLLCATKSPSLLVKIDKQLGGDGGPCLVYRIRLLRPVG